MSIPDGQLSEAFCRLAELASALGVKSINKLPACWEVQVDGRWWVAMNGHGEAVKASDGADVPPYSAWITFNGWPAGVLSPVGGVIAAGSAANEDTFIDALKVRIATEGVEVRQL
jgi:hypothetical protein